MFSLPDAIMFNISKFRTQKMQTRTQFVYCIVFKLRFHLSMTSAVCKTFNIQEHNSNLDPVVQSIVSLTISLRHKFVKQISAKVTNTLLFFVEKM